MGRVAGTRYLLLTTNAVDQKSASGSQTASAACWNAVTPLVLLCHKFRCLLWVAIGAAQHGHRDKVATRATTNFRRIVAIEFGTWRSGRNGASSGLIIFAWGKLREQRGEASS